MVTPVGNEDFLIYVMFWTILAMMLVLIYSLKQVIVTQRFIRNIDTNIEKMTRKTLLEEEKILKDEERIIADLEKKTARKTPAKKATKSKK